MDLKLSPQAREHIIAKGGAVHILALRGMNLC